MAFQEHLETLRAKPEHVRRRIAFWSSFGVSALIFMFWIGSFSAPGVSASSQQAAAGTGQSALTASVANVPSPGSSLVAGIGALGKDVWELIFGTKKVTFSTVEVSPGK